MTRWLAWDADAGELLDLHVQQRARTQPLVAAVALLLPARPAGKTMPAQHLPDRRAYAPHDPCQSTGAEVGIATRTQDRLLLRRSQSPRLALRPRGAVAQRRQGAAALIQRCHQRCAVAAGTLNREHQLMPARQSELRVSVRIHHGPLGVACLWRTRTASKDGRMYLSAVHNLCGRISYSDAARP